MITITPIKMTGIFANLAEEFIEFKRAQGYKYYNEAKVLKRFCKFTEDYPLDKPKLTRELILDWTSPREGEAKKNRMHRISCMNQFGKYLHSLGYEVQSVLPQNRWNTDTFTPYIFTHEEISRLFKAADSVRPAARSRNMHKILPILIRLLYACGLRVSEAVGLQCKDVDLNSGILTIRDTKTNRDRLIPIAKSLLELLREYRTEVIPWATDVDYFFMAPNRTILSPTTVYVRYRQILWEGGIPYGGKGKGPRLHDVRHTFAVHALQKWTETGEDLSAMLPVLSVFLGHSSLKATSQYLRLTAEVYPDLIKQVEETCAHAIPGGDNCEAD